MTGWSTELLKKSVQAEKAKNRDTVMLRWVNRANNVYKEKTVLMYGGLYVGQIRHPTTREGLDWIAFFSEVSEGRNVGSFPTADEARAAVEARFREAVGGPVMLVNPGDEILDVLSWLSPSRVEAEALWIKLRDTAADDQGIDWDE